MERKTSKDINPFLRNNIITQELEDLICSFNGEYNLNLNCNQIDSLINEINKIAHERF